MTTFGAIGIASTGLTVNRKWLDAVSDNLANVNTVRPTDEEAFQARYVIAQAAGGPRDTAGTQVAGIELGSAEGRLVYEPDHPSRTKAGMCATPTLTCPPK